MASTTTTMLAAFIPNYWDRLLGDNLRPNLYLYDLGEKRKLPANFGTTIKIPRIKKSGTRASADLIWGPDAPGTNEGGATATCTLSSEFVSGTLQKFRGAYRHSDLVIMTALSDVIQLSLEDISYELARKMDRHIRDQLKTTGPQYWAITAKAQPSLIVGGTSIRPDTGSGASGRIGSFRFKDIIFNEIILEEQNNPRFPGAGKYAAVIHPKVKYDIVTNTSNSFTGWIDVNKYNNAEKIFNGEIGSMMGFKFITSTGMLTSTTALTTSAGGLTESVARSYFLAPRAYYVTELSEMSARTFVKQLGSAGAADPTNDFATVGAKVFFTAIPGGSAFSKSSTETRLVRFLSETSV